MSPIARYDKYDGVSGGFRAPLADAITDPAQIGVPLAMGVNAAGAAVLGAGVTGVFAVYVADQAKAAGDIADLMTAGEIVDLDETVFDPGVIYYGSATGVVDTTATGARLGITVGDKAISTGLVRTRFIVRAVPLGTDA